MKKALVISVAFGVSILSMTLCRPAFSAMRQNAVESGSHLEATSGSQPSGTEQDVEKMMGSEETNPDMDAQNEANVGGKMEAEKEAPPVVKKKGKKILSGDDSFIAGPDWEFDGFVAGGQDQEIKSMFVVNDLIYLNVGVSQGFKPGDRAGIYKRGERIRDPQSGRFLGYEVRRVATVEVTNRIEDETCSTRVINASTGIEIGDLARRDR